MWIALTPCDNCGENERDNRDEGGRAGNAYESRIAEDAAIGKVCDCRESCAHDLKPPPLVSRDIGDRRVLTSLQCLEIRDDRPAIRDRDLR